MQNNVHDLVQRVHEKWRKDSVPLNPGASRTNLMRLGGLLGVELPENVAQFYSSADGMVDYESAGESLVSFWSIDRIFEEHDLASGSDANGPFLDVAFADVLVYSWCFRFRVRRNDVHVVGDGHPWELNDFSSFLDAYLTKPAELGIG